MENDKFDLKDSLGMSKKVIMFTLAGILVGAVLGYVYYAEIGCLGGTCPITSNPVSSTLYGGLIGGLLFNTFVKKPEK